MSKLDIEIFSTDEQKGLSQDTSPFVGKCAALNPIGNVIKQDLVGKIIAEQRSKNLISNVVKQPLLGRTLTEQLSKISIGIRFKQPLVGGAWAEQLSKNSIGNRFKSLSATNSLTEQLSKISIGNSFKQPLVGGAWAEQLSKISIGNRFKPSVFSTWQPIKERHPKELQAFRRYLYTLRNLLKDDEFKKSDVWVEFVKKQIEEILESDARVYYLPDMLDQEKKDIAYEKGRVKSPSMGGKTNAKPWRDLEDKVVLMAGNILKEACPNSTNQYRISTLAKEVIERNKNSPIQTRLTLPKESTIKKYIRNAVKNRELPAYLSANKPKKH